MQLMKTDGVMTMTSREIADLVESRHDSVKRAIERLSRTLFNTDGSVKRGPIISEPPMVDGAKSANGVSESVYLIGKRDSYVVVAQLCPEFTARLVDRWQELETLVAEPPKPALPDFTNPVIAARAWANEVEAKQVALLELEQAKPKVEFVDNYVAAKTGNLTFRQVCKVLKANERKFRQFLVDNRFMQKVGKAWIPYASYRNEGCFEALTGANGEHVYVTTLFTPKGVTEVAKLWRLDNAPAFRLK